MSNNIEDAAKRFAARLATYPIEEQIAVGAISNNVLNGCSWEFVRNNPELRANVDAFDKSEHCSLQEVTYDHKANITGYLVYMKLDYLLELLGKEAPGLINRDDLQKAAKHHQEAIEKLSTYMKKGYKGRIGIYCTNNSSAITLNGKTYPAFAITLRELLQICVQFKYGVVIGGAPRNPNEVLQRADAVLKACTVAPSSNAILLDIAKIK